MGVMNQTKRVFNLDMKKRGKFIGTGQDGNCEKVAAVEYERKVGWCSVEVMVWIRREDKL